MRHLTIEITCISCANTGRSGQGRLTSHADDCELRHRLISFVLLLAYGLPAITGPAAHMLHVCSDAACQSSACQSPPSARTPHSCSCRYHSPAAHDDIGRQSPEKRSSAPAWDQAGHDHSRCLICQHYSLAALHAVVVSAPAMTGLVTELPISHEQQPSGRWGGQERSRGPPNS